MRAAVFTDNDFDKVNGVTTTLKAMAVRRRGLQSACVPAADYALATVFPIFALPMSAAGRSYAET
jgi:hypothetical protein